MGRPPKATTAWVKLKLPGEFGKYTAQSGELVPNGSTIELPEEEARRLVDLELALPKTGPDDGTL